MNKTNKQIRKKKFLTYLLVGVVIVLFILSFVIAIILTQGGKITRQGIVETGSIKLEIQPDSRDLLIYLNDKQVKSDDSYINNIEPGKYTLRIESEQFHVWEKYITVKPSLVTALDIKLFPIEPELVQVTQTNIANVFFSENGDYAYYIVNDAKLTPEKRGLWRIKLENQDLFFRRNTTPEKLADIGEELLTYFSGDGSVITPDSSNNRLLIYNKTISKVVLFDINSTNTASQFLDITPSIGFFPEEVHWFNNNNSLIVSNQQIVFEYNIVNQEKTLVTYSLDNQPVYSTNNQDLYVFSKNENSIYSYQNKLLRKLNIDKIILPSETNFIKISKDPNKVLLKSGSDYYLLDLKIAELVLVYSNAYLIDFSFDGSSAIFNNNGQTIFVATENQTITQELEVKVVQAPFEIEANPRFINNSNLVVASNKSISKLQICENDGSNIVDIIDNQSIDNGFYFFQEGGSSLVALLEDNTADNILSRNLFKLSLNPSSLPFDF